MKEFDIKNEVKHILLELFAGEGISSDSVEQINLFDDLNFDSIKFITMIIEIEGKFRITIPDELLVMDKLDNVNAITKNLLNIINSQQGENDE